MVSYHHKKREASSQSGKWYIFQVRDRAEWPCLQCQSRTTAMSVQLRSCLCLCKLTRGGGRGWRNSFLGIDSGAPYTIKHTGTDHSHNCRQVTKNQRRLDHHFPWSEVKKCTDDDLNWNVFRCQTKPRISRLRHEQKLNTREEQSKQNQGTNIQIISCTTVERERQWEAGLL